MTMPCAECGEPVPVADMAPCGCAECRESARRLGGFKPPVICHECHTWMGRGLDLDPESKPGGSRG